MTQPQFSTIADIGPNELRLTVALVTALSGREPAKPELELLRLVDTYADYLSQARIIGTMLMPGENRREHEVLSDGEWMWFRQTAYFARQYHCTDMRLFARAASQGFVLPELFVNPDWKTAGLSTSEILEQQERDEHRMWWH